MRLVKLWKRLADRHPTKHTLAQLHTKYSPPLESDEISFVVPLCPNIASISNANAHLSSATLINTDWYARGYKQKEMEHHYAIDLSVWFCVLAFVEWPFLCMHTLCCLRPSLCDFRQHPKRKRHRRAQTTLIEMRTRNFYTQNLTLVRCACVVCLYYRLFGEYNFDNCTELCKRDGGGSGVGVLLYMLWVWGWVVCSTTICYMTAKLSALRSANATNCRKTNTPSVVCSRTIVTIKLVVDVSFVNTDFLMVLRYIYYIVYV